MDTDALIAHSRARFDHAAAQRVLREKYEAKMLFGYRGGMFRAGPELISVLSLYPDHDLVIKDLYDVPVQVTANELQDLARARWQEQMTAWLLEHQDLNKIR